MPWYYAGPDAKPVGPVALEELKSRRARGEVSPDTYIIEYVGQPGDQRAWKRYRDVFPAGAIAPTLVLPPPPPPPVVPPVPAVKPHPLFPSATLPATSVHPSASTAGKINPWCSWGFGLGLASLILLFPSCGLTSLVALAGLVISMVGMFKVQHNHAQSGRNLALSGILLSGATLVITVIFLAIAIPIFLKGHGQITSTEQSTNDSE